MPVLACMSGQIEDADAGGFAAGSRGGGDRDQRLQRSRHGQTFPDGRIYVIEEIGGRITSCRDSPPSRCRWPSLRRRPQMRHKKIGARRRSRPETIRRWARRARDRRQQKERHSLRAIRGRSRRAQAAQHRIGDHQHVARAELGQIHADFARDPSAEANAGRGHFKGDFAIHVWTLHWYESIVFPALAAG